MALIDEEPVDVVITDILMPEVDGIELLRTLKYSRPEMPVVVMSGGGQYDVRLLLKTADLLGAVVTLAKPFTAPDVARAVDLALRRPDQAGRGDA
jgi:DNA-binding NtrC family response regulator